MKARALTTSGCLTGFPTDSPVVVSQIRVVWSSLPVAIQRPVGSKATAAMLVPGAECRNGSPMGWPVAAFQRRAAPSRPLEANVLPSGLRLTHSMMATCPTMTLWIVNGARQAARFSLATPANAVSSGGAIARLSAIQSSPEAVFPCWLSSRLRSSARAADIRCDRSFSASALFVARLAVSSARTMLEYDQRPSPRSAAISRRTTAIIAPTAGRRRAHFQPFSQRGTGRARIGSPLRTRRRSSARAAAVA